MTATFGPREVDALQELASIGCGQAITALGKLAGRRFDMDVPEAWVGAEPGAIAAFLGGLGQDLVAVGVKLEGPLTGDLLLALPERDAREPRRAARLPAGGALGRPRRERAHGVGQHRRERLRLGGRRRSSARSSSSRCRRFARGSGRACVEALVAHAGSVALATRFSAWAEDTGAGPRGAHPRHAGAGADREAPLAPRGAVDASHGRDDAAPAPRRACAAGRTSLDDAVRAAQGRALRAARRRRDARHPPHAARRACPRWCSPSRRPPRRWPPSRGSSPRRGPLLVTRLAPDKAGAGAPRRDAARSTTRSRARCAAGGWTCPRAARWRSAAPAPPTSRCARRRRSRST